ncbi:Cilia- and flagella-associated protein 57 [Gonapodya sp. JEL0774]|nr:Cilia- and flagella-associated protein 57 [Gonapodya sp. JEL0774]
MASPLMLSATKHSDSEWKMAKRILLPDGAERVLSMSVSPGGEWAVVGAEGSGGGGMIARAAMAWGEVGKCMSSETNRCVDVTGPNVAEVLAVALHPSGLYAAVGFSDKLRVMTLLTDDARVTKEISIRGCREVCFSNGGHVFAAANNTAIQLFATWTTEPLATLKGHNGRVRSLYFTASDAHLVSAGADGAVYVWNVREGKREAEYIQKSVLWNCAVGDVEGKTVWAAGSDKTLKEVSDSMLTKEVECNTILTQIVVSRTGRMMFAGTANGTIRAIKVPLTGDPSDYQEHQAHSSPITRLRLSPDDQFLLSGAEDGSVFIFKVEERDPKGLKRERVTMYSEEVLVTRSDLEEKHVLVAELERSLEELKIEHEYQLRLKDMSYNEKIKELTEKFSHEIEDLRVKTTSLKGEKERDENRHEEARRQEETKHAQALQDQETKFNQKMMIEYEKYQDLERNAEILQRDWEQRSRDFHDAERKELTSVTNAFEDKVRQRLGELTRLQDEMGDKTREYAEWIEQIRRDIGQELMTLKDKYEHRLNAEKDLSTRLKSDIAVMRKKFVTLQKEIDEHAQEKQKAVENEKKLNNVILNLERDLTALKKEMQERDETIQDKERRVYDLKKKNQELEKYKFVLDHRIKELKQQVEPKEIQIKDMGRKIQEMNDELESLNAYKHHLLTTIEELRSSIDNVKQSYAKEHQSAHDIRQQIRKARKDLTDTVCYLQDPAVLRKSIDAMGDRYLGKSQQERSRYQRKINVDEDVRLEHVRHMEHLRAQVAMLRGCGEVQLAQHRVDSLPMIKENQGLIRQLTEMRKEKSILDKRKGTTPPQPSSVRAGSVEAEGGLFAGNLRLRGSNAPPSSGPQGMVRVATLV